MSRTVCSDAIKHTNLEYQQFTIYQVATTPSTNSIKILSFHRMHEEIDGKRSRTGGGVLWNILKAREPEAYKEIMAKGRELEKQLWQKNRKQAPRGSNDSISLEVFQATNNSGNQEVDSPQHALDAKPKFDAGESRVLVMNCLRMPVAHDDLFGED